MQETNPYNSPGGRRRDLDDDERFARKHWTLWTVTIVALAALIAVGAYSYPAIGAYLGKLNLVPAMQDQLAAAGHRIDAAEDALRGLTAQRDDWAARLAGAEARIDGTLRIARKQAEDIAAKTQQHVQMEMDQRARNLQSKVDQVQAAQQSEDARMSGFEGRLNRAQAENSRELALLRGELRRSGDAENATNRSLADLNSQVARVDRQSDNSRSDLESMHRRTDRERIGFELGVNHEREVASGFNMNVSRADVSRQRFDGWVWLMPDRRTIWIRDRGLQQPLAFYNQGDDRPRELVITRVTKYSVVGYLLVPRENAAAPVKSAGLHSF